MSDLPSDKPHPIPTVDIHDPLLIALRQLPSLAIASSREERLHRQARASYERRFEGPSSWYSSATDFVGRASVPLFLAGTVGLYMTWAIAAAAALVQ